MPITDPGHLDVGDIARFGHTFTDADSTAADPTTVQLLVTPPEDPTATYTYGVDAELTRAALGVYNAEIPATAPGSWQYRWVGTGDNPGAENGSFLVSDDVFTTPPVDADGPALSLLAQLDRVLDRAGDVDDYETEDKLAALNVAITLFEKASGRVYFPRRETVDVLLEDADALLRLPIATYDPVTSLNALTGPAGSIDIDTVTTDGRRISLNDCTRWGRGEYSADITYGQTAPPVHVARAMVLIASSIVVDGPGDDRGFAVTNEGGLTRLLTAGIGGATFSIPEVQAALQLERVPQRGGF